MSEQTSFESGLCGPRIALAPDAPRAASVERDSHVLEEGELHVADYARVFYKRRWTAITTFLVVVLSSALYTFTTTPVYEARTQILIEKESTNVVTFKEAVEQNQLTDDYYPTQYRILQSRALARRTIEALHLWHHPEFNPKQDNSINLWSTVTAPARPIARWFGSTRTETVDNAETAETKRQSAAIDRFLSRLTIAPVRNSRLVDVKFASTDASLCARIANALAKGYIDQSLEFKFLSSKEASDWLAQQLAEQRRHVEQSEQAVQRYREQTDAVSLEEKQNIVVQKLADLNAAVTRAKTERIQKEAAFNQIRALQNDRAALDTLPPILSNSFIQQQKSALADLQRQQAQLSDKLGARHPDMLKMGLAIETADARIQGEISKIIQAMGNDYQQALAQERSLNVALEQQKQEALALNRKGIEYGVLVRDAASNRQIFESLMQRTKETGISGELKASNIRIVDAAETPRSPVKPNLRNNMLLAVFGGAVLAVMLAFFFEYIDSRIKNPDEIKRHLGLPFLGMVPALFDKAAVNPLVNDGVPSTFAESFRVIRTNVLFSAPTDGGKSLVITSTGPGEGKSVVAANLAIALAQAGQRVLLIDADLRKPRVHDIFSVSQEPGLSNVMVANAKASEAIRTGCVAGLWLLPAGYRPPNPAELLGSKRFKEFAVSVQQHFDWVVIDTPPVMAATDSSVVAHVATGVLFVVGAEMTSWHQAHRALEQIEISRARFIGAVLNRVDLAHNAYYYSHYYRRSYAQYYEGNVAT